MANAYDIKGKQITFEANTDLSANLYCGLVLNTVSKVLAAGTGTTTSNEVQSLTRTSTGGTITLTFGTETTGNIAATAAGFTAAAVTAALETLDGIDPGDVTITGSAGGPLSVEFTGRYAGTNVSTLVVDNTNATGGTIVAAVVTAGGTAGTAATTGESIIGILQNKPAAYGRAATVMVDGVSKAVAGGIIAAGSKVKTTTGGKFIAVTDSDDVVAGTAITASAADGDLFTIQFHAA